jgi:hypothetical protein
MLVLVITLKNRYCHCSYYIEALTTPAVVPVSTIITSSAAIVGIVVCAIVFIFILKKLILLP